MKATHVSAIVTGILAVLGVGGQNLAAQEQTTAQSARALGVEETPAVGAAGPWVFIDPTLIPGDTPIKAIHFSELREAVNAVRSRCGLVPQGWTDPVLTPGVTPVRTVHLTELRTALTAAYRACGETPVPRFTDVARAGMPIKAVHVTELRTAVNQALRNRAPDPSGSIPAQTLTVGGEPASVDVTPYFRDPDGDTLTYTARSNSSSVVRSRVSGSLVTLTPVAEGTTTVIVTASDPEGLTATQTIGVTVDRHANRPPRASGSVPGQTLAVGGDSRSVDMTPYFSDPDGDALTYTASSNRIGVVRSRVSGSLVTLTPVAEGTATVTVTARDPGDLTATQAIRVTVRDPGAVLELSTCSYRSVPGGYSLTMEGTVRALVALSSATVDGYVSWDGSLFDDELIGMDDLGRIAAGQTRGFHIEGTTFNPVPPDRCRVRLRGRRALANADGDVVTTVGESRPVVRQ